MERRQAGSALRPSLAPDSKTAALACGDGAESGFAPVADAGEHADDVVAALRLAVSFQQLPVVIAVEQVAIDRDAVLVEHQVVADEIVERARRAVVLHHEHHRGAGGELADLLAVGLPQPDKDQQHGEHQ